MWLSQALCFWWEQWDGPYCNSITHCSSTNLAAGKYVLFACDDHIQITVGSSSWSGTSFSELIWICVAWSCLSVLQAYTPLSSECGGRSWGGGGCASMAGDLRGQKTGCVQLSGSLDYMGVDGFIEIPWTCANVLGEAWVQILWCREPNLVWPHGFLMVNCPELQYPGLWLCNTNVNFYWIFSFMVWVSQPTSSMTDISHSSDFQVPTLSRNPDPYVLYPQSIPICQFPNGVVSFIEWIIHLFLSSNVTSIGCLESLYPPLPAWCHSIKWWTPPPVPVEPNTSVREIWGKRREWQRKKRSELQIGGEKTVDDNKWPQVTTSDNRWWQIIVDDSKKMHITGHHWSSQLITVIGDIFTYYPHPQPLLIIHYHFYSQLLTFYLAAYTMIIGDL